MKSQSLAAKWIRFFFVRDRISQILFALSVVAIVIWFFISRESIIFALVSFGLLVFTLIFSFLNYVIVGRYRETAENRFYDAIYSDCDFSSPFSGGREMKKIKVHWSGFKVKRVTVFAATNSNAAKSGKGWRNLKLSVSDSFKIAGTQVVAILEDQAKGRLEFVAVTDQQIAPGGEYSAAAFEEDFRSFIYEDFSSYGTPLPRLKVLELDEDGRNTPRIKRFEVLLYDTQSSYDRSSFAANLKSKYESSAKVWIIEWTETGVNVEAVEKGSEQERRVLTESSIRYLITTSVTSSFHWYNKHYVMTSKMIQWKGESPSSITIDFLQNDLSRENNVEQFENHVKQGLAQLFKNCQYAFEWNVSATEKILTIRAV